MKRINPKTGLPFKRGDVRDSDGKVFWQRKLTEVDKEGFYSETWYAPERFEEVKKDNIRRGCIKAKNNPEWANAKNKKWSKENRSSRNANWARYFYAKLKRTPKWLTEEHHKQIKQFYELCKQKEKETGQKYNVDHIIPLRGKIVSGLHVPWNLTVIPDRENFRKSNKFNDY